MGELKFGLRLPHVIPGRRQLPLAELARDAEAAGWDSLWMSDHVVVPGPRADYPYRSEGHLPEQPWYDAIVSLAVIAGVTSEVRIGTCVLVLALRDPVVTAKQLATLDNLSAGRVEVGIGAGWLREEFDLLGIAFDTRGARLDAALATVRQVWSGGLEGTPTDPRPVGPMPVLIGGMAPPAIRRAAVHGDGWLALQPADAINVRALADAKEQLHLEGAIDPRITLRLRGPAPQALGYLEALRTVGVSEIIVDADWNEPSDLTRLIRQLRS